jgi:hypothetical protein
MSTSPVIQTGNGTGNRFSFGARSPSDTIVKQLVESLRKTVAWAECCSMRLSQEEREQLNWRDIEAARKMLERCKGG